MPYSARTIGNDPNVAVSTASTPTSKNSWCISAMRSGRVSTTCSLQPSSSGPPKSSGPRSCSCTHVPNAPSKIRTRSRKAARKSDIGDRLPERLPQLACQFRERFVARRSAAKEVRVTVDVAALRLTLNSQVNVEEIRLQSGPLRDDHPRRVADLPDCLLSFSIRTSPMSRGLIDGSHNPTHTADPPP